MNPRSLLDRLLSRLSTLPLLGSFTGAVLALLAVRLDRRLESVVPESLHTTVDSARGLLSAVAGGLIGTVTLLLTLTLVAVQVGSSRYSPRTLRSWLHDRRLQTTIATALGTTTYCLVVLREVRSIEDGRAITPHLSTLLGLVTAIVTLGLVVWSVDRLADSLSVDSVAQELLAETLAAVEQVRSGDGPNRVNADPRPGVTAHAPVDDGGIPAVSWRAGWITAIDVGALMEEVPDGAGVEVVARVGSFVLADAPVAVVHGTDDTDWVIRAIEVGSRRTGHADVGFGMLRLVDVALKAMSPGVNDPNTAIDIVNHLGTIAVHLYEIDEPSNHWRDGDRWLITPPFERDEAIRAAFDGMRRASVADPSVAVALIDTLGAVRTEVRRRDLSERTDAIDDVLDHVAAELESVDWIERDRLLVESSLRASRAASD